MRAVDQIKRESSAKMYMILYRAETFSFAPVWLSCSTTEKLYIFIASQWPGVLSAWLRNHQLDPNSWSCQDILIHGLGHQNGIVLHRREDEVGGVNLEC